MSKIHILDKSVSNRIAAGEVVEKPASVVKELVENSIDAGASKISIEIKNGGIKKICIQDDGCGIEKDDVINAFMPHATSKIETADDLDKIFTLGFRGEALASIASVSQVEMVTKTEDAEIGTGIKINGGEFGKLYGIGANKGTQITVNNLFYNTPVRRKFLRKEKTEEGEITSLVEKLILSNPNIRFKYIVDDKIKYNTTASSTLDDIYTIYGEEIAGNVIPVNEAKEGYVLKGYIGRPEISKPNRSYQTLIINGRIVRSAFVSNVIQEVYENFLMKNKYPLYVLSLTLPPESLDVNVHPSKLEVKFENLAFIHRLFSGAVYSALMEQDLTRKATTLDDEFKDLKKEDVVFYELPKDEGVSFKEQDTPIGELPREISLSSVEAFEKVEPKKIDLKSSESDLTNMMLGMKSVHQESFKEAVSKAEIKGVIFKTYILAEKDDSLYIIDQHAAHERKIYEEYKERLEKGENVSQALLSPYGFSVNAYEFDFISSHIDALREMGFEIEAFGDKMFRVTSVPYMLSGYSLEKFFEFFISNLVSYEKKPIDFLKSEIMQQACKAAIKSGQLLSSNEIDKLINDLRDNVLQCPHGRPIVIEVTKTQIEKWFKRIV